MGRTGLRSVRLLSAFQGDKREKKEVTGLNISFSFLPDYWPYFRDGVYYTLVLAFLTVVIAVLPAICLALMRLSNNKILRFISSAFIEIIRGTPMLVQVSIIYYGVFGAVTTCFSGL